MCVLTLHFYATTMWPLKLTLQRHL